MKLVAIFLLCMLALGILLRKIGAFDSPSQVYAQSPGSSINFGVGLPVNGACVPYPNVFGLCVDQTATGTTLVQYDNHGNKSPVGGSSGGGVESDVQGCFD